MIAIGNDHAAVELKEFVVALLQDMGYEVKDFGCGAGEKCDYPDKAKEVAEAIVGGECEKGILICGTGVGMSIAANKVKGIRAAVCSDEFSARMCAAHNNANILCFGQRVVGMGTAENLVRAWLGTEFEGGRHQGRVDKIMAIEE
ncbi:MAG: ribose 5-phosphate isomerase B [Clostridia bacterium]|nr:ribose 5-phosphate isomerase B [Clostridia bacterium]